jgi:uncharacterized membrane protein YgcG
MSHPCPLPLHRGANPCGPPPQRCARSPCPRDVPPRRALPRRQGSHAGARVRTGRPSVAPFRTVGCFHPLIWNRQPVLHGLLPRAGLWPAHLGGACPGTPARERRHFGPLLVCNNTAPVFSTSWPCCQSPRQRQAWSGFGVKQGRRAQGAPGSDGNGGSSGGDGGSSQQHFI